MDNGAEYNCTNCGTNINNTSHYTYKEWWYWHAMIQETFKAKMPPHLKLVDYDFIAWIRTGKGTLGEPELLVDWWDIR
jgi:hypothetical protein